MKGKCEDCGKETKKDFDLCYDCFSKKKWAEPKKKYRDWETN